MNIILDVDGTLVDGDGYNVWSRPFLKEFIEFCFATFITVSIWTAASEDWYQLVYQSTLKALLPPNKSFLFVFTGNRCVSETDWDAIESGEFYPRTISVKPLSKVWRKFKQLNRHNTLILDNTCTTYSRNFGNAIPIETFERQDTTDRELFKLMQWIPSLLKLNTVRHTEKRFWSIQTSESKQSCEKESLF